MNKSQLADLWTFPWPVMDVLIGGQSSIDLTELKVNSLGEATEFLRAYGFDPDRARDAKRLHSIFIEATAFIERQLLSAREWERGLRPPQELLDLEDTRYLLLWASGEGPTERLRRHWACAVLRVMHTIGHIEGVNSQLELAAAREQIFARFHAHIFRDDERRLWFGDETTRVELHHVEWKEAKSRNSIILKLLHKRDNVADTIYDYIGVRLVTKRLCDVMLLVKCMRQFHVVVYPNAYPSRARNHLVDVKRFRSQIETLQEMLGSGTLSPAEFEVMVGRITAAIPLETLTGTNPHSSTAYHSIQLTGRQLITVPNYRYEWLEKLRSAIDTQKLSAPTRRMLSELDQLVEGWYSLQDNLDAAAFHPFEVQIMDLDSFDQSQAGDANHDRYKLSQVRAARKRVLAKVIELSKDLTA